MDEEQRKRFEQAVERKSDAAREASHQTRQNPNDDTGATQTIQDPLINTATTQDAFDPRDKNSQKGKKTADKWNQ